MRTRYPRNINLDITFKSLEDMDGEKPNAVRQIVEKTAAENGESLQNVLDYRVAGFAAYMKNGVIETNSSHLENLQLDYYSDVWQIFIVPVSDYNRLMGENETLSEGETLIYTTKSDYPFDTISLGDRIPLKVKKTVSNFADNGVDAMQIIPSVYLFVSDFDSVIEPLLTISDPSGKSLVGMHWYYGFDLSCDDETQIAIQENLLEKLRQSKVLESGGASISCEGVAQERSGFYGLYGGLFFLGILLGVVFLFAAVLIIYYKQISEGYEDQSRFAIMQKVGMTKKEIRKSINSQVLTVFFMPLITAGVHLAFAFPMIYKLLMLFSLTNQKLLIFVTVCCFLIFTLFYVLVYRITSKAYYSIVSGAKEERE